MKKIVMLACTMLLCAGIAMAQEPVKKPAKKAETTTATAKSDKADAQVAHKGCGNCPNHKQCGKAAGAQAAVAKPEAAKPCCNKEGQKACNKNGQKACSKEAAAKNAEAKPTAKK